MSDKKKVDALDVDAKLVEEYSKAESFIQKNGKVLLIVVGAIVLLVGGYFGYRQFWLAPQEQEAQEMLFPSQKWFEIDSFNIVINGDGANASALEIADDYGATKAGSLAAYMVGRSYLEIGNYEEAIDYLEKFDGDDHVIAVYVQGLIGDAHAELEEYEEAAEKYKKAARMEDNKVTTPYWLKKAGLVYEKLGEPAKAVECYERIRKEYRESTEFADIDKFLYRAKAAAGDLEF